MTLLESSKYFRPYRKQLCLISTWLIIVFIGSRWCTGTDWNSYKELFDTLELDWTFLVNVYHFDFGYVLFNAIVKIFTDNYTLFLLINSFVTIYSLGRLLQKTSPYPSLSLFVFYSAFMIAQFMGSNRRMMAMVFILWSFYYLYERRKLAFVIMISLAFLFHRSALICLLALFIPREIISIKKTISMLLFSLFIGLLQLPAKMIELAGNILSVIVNNPIVEKMVFYSETNDEHLATSTGSVFISTTLAVVKRSVFLAFYFYIIRHNILDKFTQYLYNIYIIAFCGYLFFIGSFFQMLTAFFALVEIILISRMYSYVNERTKIILLSIIFLYSVLQLLNALNVYPELYFPYIPFWSNIQR